MNREEFYREIGNIDDDLIQEANEAHGKRRNRRMLYRVAGIAACLCLICGGILYGLQKDSLYINDMPTPAVSKIIAPADKNTRIVPVTYQELLAYYEMEQLPDVFLDELVRAEQSQFVLYEDQEGGVLFDTNILYYASDDRSKTLSIRLAKAEEPAEVLGEGIRLSEIDGVSILLAASNDRDDTAYWADFKLNGVSVQMIFDGLSEDEFINAGKEFIRLMK